MENPTHAYDAVTWIGRLSVDQDFFWFASLLVWILASILWWRHPQRRQAWAWVPGAAGAALTTALVQFGLFNPTFDIFQDRLIPDVTFVYDVQSDSGAVLTSLDYRFTENFSAGFGIAAFAGRFQERTAALTPVSLDNRVGKGSYNAHVQNGLSVIEERDEFFLRVRYTF